MGIWKRQQLLHKSESVFGDGFFASGTPTWDRAIAYNEGSLEFTPEQERLDDVTAQSRLDEMYPGHIGPRRGTLKFTQYLQGHATAPTGAITTTDQYRLIQRGLGGTFAQPVGTTIATASSATSFTLNATTEWWGYTPGRCGVKGDGRADGQAFSWSGTGSFIALPATPNVGDVVHGGNNIWIDQSAAINYERFMILHDDTANQYALMGCSLSSIEFNFPIGENSLPTVTFTYMVASWRRIARTFPDALLPANQPCAAITGGSVCIQDVGTTTRTEKKVSSFNVRINLGLEPLNGSVAGLDTFQDISGWARTRADVDGDFAVPWETTWETWWDVLLPGTLTHKSLLATLNTSPGTAVSIGIPKMFPAGRRPNYPENIRDQTYVRCAFKARYTAFGGGQPVADSPINILCG